MALDLPTDLWRLVVGRDAAAAAAVVCVSRELNAVASVELGKLLPVDKLLSLWQSSTCVQSQLCDALLLSADAVAAHPHETRKRYGGGWYHVFDTKSAIRALLRASGGIAAWADRTAARRIRADAKRRRDEERPAEQTIRRDRLTNGLAVLGLQLRSDSEVCNAYIQSGTDLARALRTAAHMHFLHEHTNGAYSAAVNEEVEGDAEHYGFYYSGIYRDATLCVQGRAQFRLPPVLPWLSQFASTAEALDAALRAADVDEHRKLARRDDLRSRRDAALAQRCVAFGNAWKNGSTDATTAEGASGSGSSEEGVPTAQQLRAQARAYGMEQHPTLHFFDAVLSTKVEVREAVAFAERLRSLDLAKSTLSKDAVALFQEKARASWEGDVGEMAATAEAEAEVRRRKRAIEEERRQQVARVERATLTCHGVGCRNLHARISPPQINGLAVCGACARAGKAVAPR